ncbi:MAG: hypothetical protein AB8B80_05220 [Marinicellaceae bacterium]
MKHVRSGNLFMIKLLALVLIAVIPLSSALAGDWGYIVADHYDCENDHMAIETERGWLLAEAYSPYSALVEGVYIYGDLTNYGFENIKIYSSKTDNTPTLARIYIDNYNMSESDASYYCETGKDL